MTHRGWIAAVAGAALATSGCGAEAQPAETHGSTDEFCQVLTNDADTLRTATENIRTLQSGSGNVLDQARAARSLAEAARLVDDLNRIAPPEITSDVRAVHDALTTIGEGSMDPADVATRAETAWSTIQDGEHLTHLRQFAADRCGVTLD